METAQFPEQTVDESVSSRLKYRYTMITYLFCFCYWLWSMVANIPLAGGLRPIQPRRPLVSTAWLILQICSLASQDLSSTARRSS